jgi:hypothetical protein
MDSKVFQDELHRKPFEVFDIKTTDGDTFRIIHPDYAILSPDGMTVVAFDRDSHHRIIDMRHIVSLEPPRRPASQKGRR